MSKLTFTSRSLNQAKGVLKRLQRNSCAAFKSQRMFDDGNAQIGITEQKITKLQRIMCKKGGGKSVSFIFYYFVLKRDILLLGF